MMTPINLGALRISEECGDLYDVVKRSTGFITGTHDVDISSLPIAPQARFRLAQWSFFMNAAVVEHKQQVLRSRAPEPVAPVVAPRVAAKPAEPAAPVVEPPKPEPQVDIAAHAREVVAREEAELKRLKDESRGIARLQQYSDEQGLEETPENLAAVQTFINEKVRGYWSQEIVDATIQNLGPRGTNVLTWKPKTAPAPPPPTPAEPSGEILQPWQLKIDATEQEMKAASVVALKDLIARRRKEHPYIRPRGSFSSQF